MYNIMKAILFCSIIFWEILYTTSSTYEVDEDDWVDPFDLLNYDRHTKTMTNSRKNMETISDFTNLRACKDSLFVCENAMADLLDEISKHNCTGVTSVTEKKQNIHREKNTGFKENETSEVYLKRFINLFMGAFRLQYVTLDADTSQKVSFTMTISAEQLIILRKFGKDHKSVSLNTLDETFTNLMDDSNNDWYSVDATGWFRTLINCFSDKKNVMRMCVCSVPVIAFVMIIRGNSLYFISTRLVLMIVCVGFVVKYMQMYEAEEIRQYLHQKLNEEVPPECKPASQISLWEWLFYGYRSNIKKCQEYHEAILIDSSLHVSPVDVLSDVLSSFFLYPAGSFATAIADFSKILLGELPFGTNWIVYIITLFFIAFIVMSSICLFFGYGISMPFGFRILPNREVPRINGRPVNTSQSQGDTSPVPISQVNYPQPVINIHINSLDNVRRANSGIEEINPNTFSANVTRSNSLPSQQIENVPINRVSRSSSPREPLQEIRQRTLNDMIRREDGAETSGASTVTHPDITRSNSFPPRRVVNAPVNSMNSSDGSPDSSIEEIEITKTDIPVQKSPSMPGTSGEVKLEEMEAGQGDGFHVKTLHKISSFPECSSGDCAGNDLPQPGKENYNLFTNDPPLTSGDSQNSDSSEDNIDASFVKI